MLNDNYKATLSLSKDYKTLIINNFKPVSDYKYEEMQAEREKHIRKMAKLAKIYERKQKIKDGQSVSEMS